MTVLNDGWKEFEDGLNAGFKAMFGEHVNLDTGPLRSAFYAGAAATLQAFIDAALVDEANDSGDAMMAVLEEMKGECIAVEGEAISVFNVHGEAVN